MIILLIALIVIWQLLYFLFVNVLEVFKPYAVPSPSGVWECLIKLSANGTLLKALGNSLLRGVIGFLLAVIIGIILGLFLNGFPYLKKNVKPLILGLQTLPSICWVPFSILWFGLSSKAILFVVIMGSVFGIAIAVDNAINNVPLIYKRVALNMGASMKQMYVKVIFPACFPELIVGLKQGWSFAWRALMSGEVMTTSIGLGQTLIAGRDLADINQVMLVMIVIILVGIVVDKVVFGCLEYKILKSRGLR